MLLTYWLNYLYDMRVKYYMSQIDSATFMSWREKGIEGVADICGC
jgi:hypothetical protein